MDSVNGKWYGLYADKEFDKLYERFQYNSENDETARRKLFMADFTKNNSGDLIINKTAASSGSNYFLHGGFLLDKNTAMPVHYDNGWLVVSKEQIGNEAKIIVHHVDFSGKAIWSYNTQLKDWFDWNYAGNLLFVFGVDNKNLSGHQANVLLCVDLKTGLASKYDYMKRD